MSGEELVPLLDLEDVQLAPAVTRILGQNAGPYTLQGTNTYLIQAKDPGTAILLDTGEGKEAYLPLLKQAFREKQYKTISDIIISHYHHDHTLGLVSILDWLQEMGVQLPKVHKFPSVQKEQNDKAMLDMLGGHSAYKEKEKPFEHLKDGQLFELASDSTLRVLHTPGHTEDSASFLLETKDITCLFTADTVLGQGTAVFVDLKALISSLERMIRESQQASATQDETVRLFCGHGPVVDDGVAKMKQYIEHRMEREKQVLEALKKASEPQTAEQLVRTIYGPKLPEKLILAAQNGIILHLKKLEQEAKVKRLADPSDPKDDVKAHWELASPASNM